QPRVDEVEGQAADRVLAAQVRGVPAVAFFVVRRPVVFRVEADRAFGRAEGGKAQRAVVAARAFAAVRGDEFGSCRVLDVSEEHASVFGCFARHRVTEVRVADARFGFRELFEQFWVPAVFRSGDCTAFAFFAGFLLTGPDRVRA